MKNTTTFRKDHEYVMVCFKSQQQLNKSFEKPNWENEYGNPDNDPRGNYKSGVISKKEEASNPNHQNYYTVTSPSGKRFTRQFDCSQEEFNRLDKDGRIYWGKNGDSVPAIKIFVEEKREVTTSSILDYKDMTTTVGSKELESIFEIDGLGAEVRPKPVALIKKLSQIGTDKNDIILDFFSGSATTAHAVMQLNAEDGGKRQFIMVQLPEVTDEKSEAFKAGYKNICEIGKERIRRAGAKIKEQNPNVDVGFKVLKLDTSNLVKWDDTPVSDTEVLKERFDTVVKTLKFDRSELDVVYEVMLKLGIPLIYKVNLTDINGRKVYSIGDDGLILVCLDGSNGGITPEDITEMCDLTPAKIVAAEEAFKDDIALSNAYYISKDKGIEIELL